MSIDVWNATCGVLDDVVSAGLDAAERSWDDSPLRAWIGGALVVASVGALVCGRHLLAPLTALAALAAAFALVYTAAAETACRERVLSALVVGVCGAALALWALRKGIFLIGAVAFAGSAHVLCESIPALENAVPETVPRVGHRSLVQWGIVAGAVVVGGCVTQVYRKEARIVMSSVVGGVGLASAVDVLLDDAVAVPAWTHLAVATGATCIGVWVQHRRPCCRRTVVKDEGRRAP